MPSLNLESFYLHLRSSPFSKAFSVPSLFSLVLIASDRHFAIKIPVMSRSTSPNHGLLASPSSNSDNGYDEERLQYGGVVPRWSKLSRQGLRVPRLRRMGLCLLLIDLFIVGILVHMFNPLITLLRRNEVLFGARLTLPLDQPYADGSADKNAIPRILHQTSATEVVPEKWVESVNGCKEVYSKFEYKHWTDELARQFIEKEYNWFLDIWDGYPYPIQRADAIRYFVLHYYGGLYLDMDTTCNNTIPLNQIEADGGKHHAVFKSTTPTGVSNDLMIASAHHPVFTLALSRLRFYNDITRFWSGLLPHAAIMIAAGPLFITMAAKNYLLEQPSLPDKAFSVINATELAPYITDLEGSSWHHGDTKTLMYVGDRPWIWFGLGAIGLTIGLHIINNLLSRALRRFDKAPSGNDEYKMAKLT